MRESIGEALAATLNEVRLQSVCFSFPAIRTAISPGPTPILQSPHLLKNGIPDQHDLLVG